MGISIHHHGAAVYVTGTGNHRVQVFNYTGGFNHTFGSKCSGGEQFLSPAGVDVTKKTRPANMGMVAVADTGNDRISVWHVNGTFAFDFGSEGSGGGNFSSPWSVARARVNWPIFVADTGNDRVQLFESDGEYARRARGSHGSGSHQLDGPRLIDEGGGTAMIADAGNDRVQRRSGARFVGNFGSSGSGEGELLSPTGAARGSLSQIYVADTGNHRVHVLHGDGRHSFAFGSEGDITDPDPPAAVTPPAAGNGTDPSPPAASHHTARNHCGSG